VETLDMCDSGVFKKAYQILSERELDLVMLDALPKPVRTRQLQCGRRQRRIMALRRVLQEWWGSANLGDAGRKRLTTISEEALTAYLAEHLHERELHEAPRAYAMWRESATRGLDELGLVFHPGDGCLSGHISVARSMLQSNGGGIWEFLEASGMLSWVLPSEQRDVQSGSESEESQESLSVSDAESWCLIDEKDSDFQAESDEETETFLQCPAARVQMLIFEAIVERIKEAGVAACPHIRRLAVNAAGEEIVESVAQFKSGEDNTSSDGDENCIKAECDDVDRASPRVQEAEFVEVADKKKKRATKEKAPMPSAVKPSEKKSKPSSARSAYQLFVCEAGPGGAIIAKEGWRELSVEERQRFEEAAKAEKKQYSEQLAEWQKKKELVKSSGPKERRGGRQGGR